MATEAWASPHELAWNIGTTGSTGRTRTRRRRRRASPPSSAGTCCGGCRPRPWGCRWCRSCSTCSPPGSRRRRRTRPAPHRRATPRSRVVRARRAHRRRAPAGAVVHHDEVANVFERRQQRRQQREQRAVDEDHLVVGVVDDVGQLFGEQPDVEGVQHPAGARRGEVQLQVAVGVPRERGDASVGGDAEGVEHAAEAPGAVGPGPVGGATAAPTSAVTIVLWAKQRSARSKRWTIDNGTSCISPRMAPKVVGAPDHPASTARAPAR